MKKSVFSRGGRKSCAAGFLGLTLALTMSVPATATVDPDQVGAASSDKAVITPTMRAAQGSVAAYVQFAGEGAFEASGQDSEQRLKESESSSTGQSNSTGQADQEADAQQIKADVEQKAEEVASQSEAEVLYTTHNALRGAAIEGDAQQIRQLAERDDVVKISKIIPKTASNAGSTIDTQSLASWTNTGHTGQGVRIAIIDTGIDYTHADFAGPGTAEAYQKAQESQEMPAADSGLYDPNKFVGGYDLAGDDYDAMNPEASTPKPDSNPLDCQVNGHGTHVAGTAAGYGVGSDGKTYRGDYKQLSDKELRTMKIGPGSAPQAQLIGLRIFGCSGSTNLTGQGLDRAMDPNGDGDFSDRADIINLSLGADFGVPDDPENDIINELTRKGVLSVVAAGNANSNLGVGDTYSILGVPPNAVSALTVANSRGSTYLADGAKISASMFKDVEVSGDYTVQFDYAKAKPEQLTGTVVAAPAENKYGCEAFSQSSNSAGKFAGKWVLIDWTDPDDNLPCGSKVRADNIKNAGGAGMVLTSRGAYPTTNAIAGNDSIPGVRLNPDASEAVRDATMTGGSFTITLDPQWRGAVLADSGALDQINPSSARGQHGSEGFTKPDVAAPGTGIVSAGVSLGNEKATMTGTSMSAPLVSGIAALVYEAHRDYTAQDLKAAIMNSAKHDVTDAEGNVLAVDRVGSGRVDALAAIETDLLAYNADSKEQVSTSFGVVEAPVAGQKIELERKILLENKSEEDRDYQLALDQSVTMPGVSLEVDPQVSVPAKGQAQVTVKAVVDPAKLEKTADPGLEKTQLDFARQYIAQASGRLKVTREGQELRVPVQIAPKPVAQMEASLATPALAKAGSSAEISFSGDELSQPGYQGLVGAFELGARSERMKAEDLAMPSQRRVDLQYVGATTNADQTELAFGISTWGTWDTLNLNNLAEILIDTNNDGNADYMLDIDRTLGVDYPMATLYGYEGEDLLALETLPVNGAWGDVDTNTMDTNTLVAPVSLAALGLSKDEAKSIKYKVDTYSAYTPQDPQADDPVKVDSTDWIDYKPFKADLAFSGAEPHAGVLYKDSAETKLTVERRSGEAKSILFLHMHNATGDLSGAEGQDGGRAQVIDLAAAQS